MSKTKKRCMTLDIFMKKCVFSNKDGVYTVETSAKKESSKRSSFRNPRREVENTNLDISKTRFPNIEARSVKVFLSLYTSTDLSRFESRQICKNLGVQMSRCSTEVSDFGFDRVVYRLFPRSFFSI